jgi:hypothetical protein
MKMKSKMTKLMAAWLIAAPCLAMADTSAQDALKGMAGSEATAQAAVNVDVTQVAQAPGSSNAELKVKMLELLEQRLFALQDQAAQLLGANKKASAEAFPGEDMSVTPADAEARQQQIDAANAEVAGTNAQWHAVDEQITDLKNQIAELMK